MEDAREWLETDGLGGYAIGTVDGIRTRRYHGWLVAATRPPDGRMVLVAGGEVFVETAAGRFALSSHRYRGDGGDVVHPDGRTRLVGFAPAPWPRWTWACADGTRIAGELVMVRGAAQVALRFSREAGTGPARLWLRPLLAGRDHHALHHANPAFRFDAERAGVDRVTWRPYDGVPAIACAANAAYDHAPDWYRGFAYAHERDRGLDAEEDLATPGVLAFDLAAGPARLAFAAGGFDTTVDVPAAARVDAMFAAERDRRARFGSALARAADAYIVARGPSGRTVIAGYPWFADWGRDTFIALRGLCLATGRFDDARAILTEWSGAVSAGMLPNRYTADGTTPEYNSVDAALWFVIAAAAFLATPAATAADRRALTEASTAIVDGYARGTRHRIRGTPDGLLACGEPGVQLTWMDAKVGDDVITPRIGKPVEIQALWLNALAIAGRADAVARGRAAFAARFWNAAAGQLDDVVDVDHVPGTADRTCRPNQILAIGGLPLAIFDGARARTAIDTVERELWTPVGPRTLAPRDPRYQARYTGGPVERDRAYHNGPVWPWLAAAFVDAWCRVRGDTPSVRRDAHARFVAPLAARAADRAGHLPEMFGPEPPHAACGCPFQAWSVAALLALTATRGGA